MCHYQPRMIDAKSVGQQPILRFHHVDVTVARKFRVQPVARLARFADTDSVWQHDKKSRRVERLIFTEQFTGEFRLDGLRAAASRPMHDENGISDFSLCVFLDLAQRSIMNPQLRQSFTRCELEILDRIVAFARRRTECPLR
jgi:hypothetical protein